MQTQLQKIDTEVLPAAMFAAAAKRAEQPETVVSFVARQLSARFSGMPRDVQAAAATAAITKVLHVSGLQKPEEAIMNEIAGLLIKTYPSWGVDDPRAAYRAYITGKLEITDPKTAEFYGGMLTPRPLFVIFAAYDVMRRKVHNALVTEQEKQRQAAAQAEKAARTAEQAEKDKEYFLSGQMFPEPVPYTDTRLDWRLYEWAKEAGFADLDEETRKEIWGRAKAIATEELAQERNPLTTTLAAAINDEAVRLRATSIGKAIILAEIAIPGIILHNMP